MTTPERPDVRDLAVEAVRTEKILAASRFGDSAAVRDAAIADAVLAAVTPVIRRQVAEERTYPNVFIDGKEWEHSDRRGPGCWHPAGGMGRCLSWQGLIHEAESIGRLRATQTIDEEQSNG